MILQLGAPRFNELPSCSSSPVARTRRTLVKKHETVMSMDSEEFLNEGLTDIIEDVNDEVLVDTKRSRRRYNAVLSSDSEDEGFDQVRLDNIMWCFCQGFLEWNEFKAVIAVPIKFASNSHEFWSQKVKHRLCLHVSLSPTSFVIAIVDVFPSRELSSLKPFSLFSNHNINPKKSLDY
ncbi:hypothetical protein L6452_17652 [Arctium lappa]|uniref:Uncharacterized protein n=1 Tax=Arctium lappa TaxID=4217 RepID=A0ACB9C3Z3_ARCLA|nr:hypothetical protein L6452_17652 [Arctium lappa]